MMNYNDYFWGDSVLEKIEIVYDKIIITVFNDVLQKNISIECYQCIGMSELICWDETILENIVVYENVDERNHMINQVRNLYGNVPNDFGKSMGNAFLKVKLTLINELSFSVICKEICFKEIEKTIT